MCRLSLLAQCSPFLNVYIHYSQVNRALSLLPYAHPFPFLKLAEPYSFLCCADVSSPLPSVHPLTACCLQNPLPPYLLPAEHPLRNVQSSLAPAIHIALCILAVRRALFLPAWVEDSPSLPCAQPTFPLLCTRSSSFVLYSEARYSLPCAQTSLPGLSRAIFLHAL